MSTADFVRYQITDIQYDVDDPEDLDGLPESLLAEVPADVLAREARSSGEVDEFLSDWISNETGFCHKGFKAAPIKETQPEHDSPSFGL